MSKNLNTLKMNDGFRKFIRKVSAYRYTEEIDENQLPMQEIPNLIMKYFKINNNRYLELINMEYEDGNK